MKKYTAPEFEVAFYQRINTLSVSGDTADSVQAPNRYDDDDED